MDPGLACADVDFIQVREPALTVHELAPKVRGLIHANGPRILVNDRIDVAIACGAAGVHLRDGSVSPKMILLIAPPGFVVTVACHDAECVLRAEGEGADYAVLAPIFAPLSKPTSRPPLGLATLARNRVARKDSDHRARWHHFRQRAVLYRSRSGRRSRNLNVSPPLRLAGDKIAYPTSARA